MSDFHSTLHSGALAICDEVIEFNRITPNFYTLSQNVSTFLLRINLKSTYLKSIYLKFASSNQSPQRKHKNRA